MEGTIEEDVSIYWLILRKRKGRSTGTRKRRHYIALCAEVALEEAVDLS
jgi:hypothetical protein